MTFAAPGLALLVAACVIPPLILLYFLKLRRREQVIPSTLLWKTSVQDLQANAPFQRLRMNLLLFLQLLALLLLLTAIAQPQWEGLIPPAARTVLMIDRSGSMTATDVDPSRLDEAKRQAIEYVNGIGSGGWLSRNQQSEKVMVITFADEAYVQSPFTNSKAELTSAINAIQPSHRGTRLSQALELARAYTINTDPETDRPTGPPASIILYSDGRIQDLKEVVARETIRYRPIGDPDVIENVGFTQFSADRTPTNLAEVMVYARVANYRPNPVAVDVLFSIGDQLVATKRLTVPPAYSGDPLSDAETNDTTDTTEKTLRPGTTGVQFPLVHPSALTLGVSLDINDDPLEADNRAYIVIPPAKQLRVGLVGAKSFIPGTALEGIPFIKVIDTISPGRFNKLVETEKTDQYDVIVIDDEPLQSLSPGRYLIFGSPVGMVGFTEKPDAVSERVLDWEVRHPVNRWVTYDPLYIDSYHPLTQLPPEASILAEGSRGPVLVEVNRGPVRAIVVPFALMKSSWFADENMIKFMQNATRYLGHSERAVMQEPINPGEAIVAHLPNDATEIQIERPADRFGDGPQTEPLSPTDPTSTVYRTETAGLYAVTFNAPDSSDRGRYEYAVNMTDEREGRIQPAPTVTLGPDEAQTLKSSGSIQKRPLWPWAALAALAILMLEWWVYGRRSYI